MVLAPLETLDPLILLVSSQVAVDHVRYWYLSLYGASRHISAISAVNKVHALSKVFTCTQLQFFPPGLRPPMCCFNVDWAFPRTPCCQCAQTLLFLHASMISLFKFGTHPSIHLP